MPTSEPDPAAQRQLTTSCYATAPLLQSTAQFRSAAVLAMTSLLALSLAKLCFASPMSRLDEKIFSPSYPVEVS